MRHHVTPVAHPSFRIAVLIAATLLAWPGVSSAQLRRPRAEITPVVGADGVPAGGTIRVALQVILPEGLHVQSDAPRDPTLIPTVLTVEPPAGVTVDEVVYPAAKDFTMAGQPEPLAVFDHVFAVGARLTIPSGAPAGEIVVPASLRYQACDDQMCFPPATARSQWTIRVVPAGARVLPQHEEAFAGLAFGKGKPSGGAETAQARQPRPPQVSPRETASAQAPARQTQTPATPAGGTQIPQVPAA
jgi:DsbC/DsbD-like thiol-disulfide interchange protein